MLAFACNISNINSNKVSTMVIDSIVDEMNLEK